MVGVMFADFFGVACRYPFSEEQVKEDRVKARQDLKAADEAILQEAKRQLERKRVAKLAKALAATKSSSTTSTAPVAVPAETHTATPTPTGQQASQSVATPKPEGIAHATNDDDSTPRKSKADHVAGTRSLRDV